MTAVPAAGTRTASSGAILVTGVGVANAISGMAPQPGHMVKRSRPHAGYEFWPLIRTTGYAGWCRHGPHKVAAGWQCGR